MPLEILLAILELAVEVRDTAVGPGVEHRSQQVVARCWTLVQRMRQHRQYRSAELERPVEHRTNGVYSYFPQGFHECLLKQH